MHTLEPFYMWRDMYQSEEDERSPFYGREHSEFEFTHKIYNFLIHPQWDEFGSSTLFIKILWADYEKGFTIIEMIGEWNDTLHNDIMWLKREIIETLMGEGINKFILIGENVLNFHASDDCYYEEWFQELDEGWIAFVNFSEHVLSEFKTGNIDYYVNFGGELDNIQWRTLHPNRLFTHIEKIINHRLN